MYLVDSLIWVDISSDTVCRWCCVGKKNLGRAISMARGRFDFEVHWHPFFLNPTAPNEGMDKREYYRNKFRARVERIAARMHEVLFMLGLEYNMSGLTGNTMDSHRLINYAGKLGPEKQHQLVEKLFLGYFNILVTKAFLVEAADKVGIAGAAEFFDDPNNGIQEVKEDFARYSSKISGVPH
ncbi:hypothetical protein MLD38_021236 [Melastoma candidum]|uniref:Uncharacterized protein n=1 Tax=Melastoma candidum TaxID=119954 RepID=A0ACB9QFN4_9MYRT|nr:hypothetical protein MLD38_021236 [Melastoma candidum]